MDMAIKTLPLSFPATDMDLVKDLVKKFGWKLGKGKKSGIEEAMSDIAKGRTYDIDDIDEYFKNLGIE